MFGFAAFKLLVTGGIGALPVPAFLKTKTVWVVFALALWTWFVWHKATASANARYELQRQQSELAKENERARLASLQQQSDLQRIEELKELVDELKKKNRTEELARLTTPLSNDCARCRVPRSFSDGGLR